MLTAAYAVRSLGPLEELGPWVCVPLEGAFSCIALPCVGLPSHYKISSHAVACPFTMMHLAGSQRTTQRSLWSPETNKPSPPLSCVHQTLCSSNEKADYYKIFADISKLGWHCWSGALTQSGWCPYRTERSHQHTGRLATWRWRLRLKLATISQGKPGTTRNKSKRDPSLQLLKEEWLCQFLNFRLQASRTVKKYIHPVLSQSVCATFHSNPGNWCGWHNLDLKDTGYKSKVLKFVCCALIPSCDKNMLTKGWKNEYELVWL